MWKIAIGLVAILAIAGVAFLFIGPGSKEPGSEADHQLLAAAQKGDLKGVQDAIAKGADVSFQRQMSRTDKMLGKDNAEEGYTALHYLAQWKTPEATEAAKLLIEKGAKVNTQTGYGNTPLVLAVGYLQVDIVKLLLASGADPSIKNKWGGDAKDAALKKRFENDATRELKALLTNAQPGK